MSSPRRFQRVSGEAGSIESNGWAVAEWLLTTNRGDLAMKRVTSLAVALLAVAAVLAFGAPASAQEVDENAFEIYGGLYVPGIDDLDNDITYGLRFGGRPADQFGWSLEAGYFDLTQNNTRPLEDVIGSANAWLVDLSGIWYIAGSDFGVFAGVGFATVDIDVLGTTQDESDDAITYNYGVHYAFNFGEKYLVKPEIRWRKFDGDTYEKTDEEYSLSFGWRF
jgi:hypothetical protein